MKNLSQLLTVESYCIGALLMASSFRFVLFVAEDSTEMIGFIVSMAVASMLGWVMCRLILGNAQGFSQRMRGFSGKIGSLPPRAKKLFKASQFSCFGTLSLALLVVVLADESIDSVLFSAPGIALGWAMVESFRRRVKLLS